MSSKHIFQLMDNLLNNQNFPLVPHHPKPNRDLKFSFEFFNNLKSDLIIKELANYFDNPNIEYALSIVSHYKGEISYFDNNLDYDTYKKLEPFLDKKSLNKFMIKFYKIYVSEVFSNNLKELDNVILDYVITIDLVLYIDISIKLNLDNIHKVFSIDKSKVFYWINNHDSKYQELKKLNQPDYIFNNMNGKLDINEETLKYFFEICPPNIEIFKDLKKSLSLETMWKFSKHKLSVEFFLEIVDTFEDLNTLINLPNIPLESLESILNKIKTKYPNIYENFNSLLVMKKEFP